MADKPKILLVDDEPSITKVVAKRLELAGFEVLTASDGQEGLQKAQTAQPDLLILDLMLPKLNGYEVCSMLKGDARFQKTPIILFSAKAQEKDEKLGLECGANAYVTKPFKAETLLEQIRALLPGWTPAS
jgi:DNA-binding response OmpR family regulator